MRMPPPRKPIYLMTASVFFVGCSASQAHAAAALAGLYSPRAAAWADLKSYTRIELPTDERTPFEELDSKRVA